MPCPAHSLLAENALSYAMRKIVLCCGFLFFAVILVWGIWVLTGAAIKPHR